jgi:DNA-binding NtrC family response regulator
MAEDSTEIHDLPRASQWIRMIQRYQSDHPDLVHLLDVIERMQDSPYRTQVLLLGEAGTGKEGLARAMHALMHPHDAPFIEASLAGRGGPEALAELCGTPDEPGLLERADGGTLYVDEIATLTREMQARLIAALRGSVRRVGTRNERPLNLTVVAATDHDLAAFVADGRFRHDLYWRLARLVLTLPPLRERRRDVPRLALWIGSRILARHKNAQRLVLEEEREPDNVVISRAAVDALVEHDWPGNMRELDAVIERALLLYSNGRRIEATDVRRAIASGPRAHATNSPTSTPE